MKYTLELELFRLFTGIPVVVEHIDNHRDCILLHYKDIGIEICIGRSSFGPKRALYIWNRNDPNTEDRYRLPVSKRFDLDKLFDEPSDFLGNEIRKLAKNKVVN